MIEEFSAWLADARERTLALASGLPPGALLGPRLAIVNPPLWELGHVAWFQERWLLRRDGAPSLRADADRLYDSAAIPHDVRWDLPLPAIDETLDYLGAVARAVAARSAGWDDDDLYFARLAVFHEDMHGEAIAFTRQTLGYPAPRLPVTRAIPAGSGSDVTSAGDARGDVLVPGGTFLLGALPAEPFVFDNEKWAHPVELAPFAIAREPVTQGQFLAFVEDGGYRDDAAWSADGRRWRDATEADRPAYWERRDGRWRRREFDGWVDLEPDHPMVHVSWFEAEAFCRRAGRRLPTEVEWEAAAAGEPGPGGRLSRAKRRFPWGAEPPDPARAHLAGGALRPVDVRALPAGDSAFGCRQLLGNVWEWTSSDFLPYPGFEVDPYREYSQPWFGTHKVLRGGSFATPARLLRNTWRNFYTPDRRDPWAGFRTCAS
jgi:iron(II)-dependent oxidoreductase